MLLQLPSSLAALTLLALPLVSAHGWISNVTVSGKVYPGANPSWHLLGKSPSVVWYSDNYGQHNPLFSSQAGTNDVACHINATAGSLVVSVTAGDTLELTWETPEGGPWRTSHEGPVLDYLASCNGGDCRKMQAADLEFFKIAESGMFVSPHKTDNGTNATFGLWGTDILRNAGNKWSVVIPSDLSGQYVLRSELIALMAAGHTGHAQMFPQCVNLDIAPAPTSSIGRVASPCSSGAECRLGRNLYNETEPGLAISIHEKLNSYPCPGPAIWQPVKQECANANPLPANLKPLPMPVAGRNEHPSGSGSGSSSAAATASATASAGTSDGVQTSLTWRNMLAWGMICLSMQLVLNVM